MLIQETVSSNIWKKRLVKAHAPKQYWLLSFSFSPVLVVIKVVRLGNLFVMVYFIPVKFLTTEENLLLCAVFLGNDAGFLKCPAVLVESDRLSYWQMLFIASWNKIFWIQMGTQTIKCCPKWHFQRKQIIVWNSHMLLCIYFKVLCVSRG